MPSSSSRAAATAPAARSARRRPDTDPPRGSPPSDRPATRVHSPRTARATRQSEVPRQRKRSLRVVPPWTAGDPPHSCGQPEVRAERRTGVLGTEDAALTQQRDDAVDEVVQAAGSEVRDKDEAVGRVFLDV